MTADELQVDSTTSATAEESSAGAAAGVDSSDLPEIVFTPDSSLKNPRALASEIIGNLWSGREMSWRMFVRNIRGLYRQTFLGLFWAFLPPLANTAVWAFLHSTRALNLGEGLEVNYILYVMTGMVVWQSFVEAFQAPLQSVSSNRNMLSKIRFPQESVLLVRFFEVLFNLLIRFIVLVPVVLIFGVVFSPAMFLAPLAILFLILLGFGLGLFLMPFGMLYHDVGRFILVAIPIWMIITPIVYAPASGGVAATFNVINPAAPLLMTARDLIVFGHTDYWLAAGIFAGLSVPLVAVGLVFFHLAIPILVERVST